MRLQHSGVFSSAKCRTGLNIMSFVRMGILSTEKFRLMHLQGQHGKVNATNIRLDNLFDIQLLRIAVSIVSVSVLGLFVCGRGESSGSLLA